MVPALPGMNADLLFVRVRSHNAADDGQSGLPLGTASDESWANSVSLICFSIISISVLNLTDQSVN